MPARSFQSGFTIIEMMIVVLIIGVLSMMAVPAMRDMVRQQRVKTAAFDVFSGLILARSEAIKRNQSVTITPTGGDWANGWTATDANGTVVARKDAITNVTLTGPVAVTYTGTGRLAAALAAPFVITTTGITQSQFANSADADQRLNRCVRVDLSGRPTSVMGATC